MTDNKETYRLLFNPGSIAVIGASSDPLKPGGKVLKNIIDGGYRGDLWPVNPKAPEIMQLPAFKDIDSLPQAPDLSLIAIPAPFVLDAVKALGEKGTRAVIILTAGFGETGEEGKAVEREILSVANGYGMTVVGPNCSGFLTPAYAGKFAGIMPRLVPGKVDFVSGSGATLDYLMETAVTRGLQFSTLVNMGNSIQIGVEDILELLDENHGPESSRILMLYMESVRKPQKLLRHVQSLIRKGCAVVGIKSGVTEAGAKAAASHTGAMATSDNAVQALFDKAGIVRVKSKIELIETACMLSSLDGYPKGNRGCVVTDAGGPGVMATDEMNRSGISVPPLQPETISDLKEILPSVASFENPIDCLPSRDGDQIRGIYDVLCEREDSNIDFAFMISGHSGMTDNWDTYEGIIEGRKRWSIPVVPVMSSITTCAGLLERVIEAGEVFFVDEVSAAEAVGRLVNRPELPEDASAVPGYDKAAIADIVSNSAGTLSADDVEKVVAAAGFQLPTQVVATEREALSEQCTKIGFPLVMKVVGPLHKSDVGGVKVGIQNLDAADDAWQELSRIDGFEGVLIQKMVAGTEVIMGAAREEGYGHLIMFGLGGIYTEALKDVSFALAPLSHGEARRMIEGIRAFPILQGIRGEEGMDLDILADYLVRLSLLVHDFPEISEMDLNPVKGTASDLYAVDARIIK